MNERIKQMIFSLNEKVGVHWTNEDKIKFAELIVRECVDKCEFVANMATITNTGEMARKTKATADSCATMIKQHFGVE